MYVEDRGQTWVFLRSHSSWVFFVTGFLLDFELTDWVSLVARKLAPGAPLFSGSSVLGLLLGLHTFFYLFTFYLTLFWALDSSVCTCKATLSTLPSPQSYFFFTPLILPSFTWSHYAAQTGLEFLIFCFRLQRAGNTGAHYCS